MAKFKIGDTVNVTLLHSKVNEFEGIIVDLKCGIYGVDFGVEIKDLTHTCMGILEAKTGYYAKPNQLTLVERNEKPVSDIEQLSINAIRSILNVIDTSSTKEYQMKIIDSIISEYNQDVRELKKGDK